MKPWCHNSNTIWAYDKSTQKSEERNISRICGKDYFHSINAGSFHTTEAALERIFSALPLESYVVSLNDVELKTLIEFNQKFTFIDEWKIKYRKTRTDVPKKKRNCIIQEIRNVHDNHIEDEWNRLFENGWREFCCGLIYHIGLSLLHFGTVTQEQADTLFCYYVMFDWRSFSGNEQVKEVFDLFKDIIVTSIECDNPSDLEKIRAEMLEMKRNVLLSAFDRFFSHSLKHFAIDLKVNLSPLCQLKGNGKGNRY